jgi:predicted nucleic acid-binding protein
MEDAYLLDTSIASIAWDSGNSLHSEVRQRLALLGETSIFICAVSIAEVEYGLQISPGADPERHAEVRQAMQQYTTLAVDHHSAEVYGPVRGELFKRYATRDKRGRLKEKRPEELVDKTTANELGIQENDLWIVSIAVQYDLVFITRDKKIERILGITKELFNYDRYEVWDLAATQQSNEDQ